jgi:hypothetical protein
MRLVEGTEMERVGVLRSRKLAPAGVKSQKCSSGDGSMTHQQLAFEVSVREELGYKPNAPYPLHFEFTSMKLSSHMPIHIKHG